MTKQQNSIFLTSLSANPTLAKKISENLKTPLANMTISRFADGEILARPEQPVRNKDVVIIQSTSKPVNDHLMELLIAIDAFKRASAKSITVICPYYGYARQDRKSLGREPITAKLVSDLLQTAGMSHIAIMDIHSDQTQGFFNVPMDSLSSIYLTMSEIIKNDLKGKTDGCVIVSPDYGAVKRARKISEKYKMELAILDKRRPRPNVAEIVNVLGDVKNKTCIIFDDMIDTGGTIIAAADILRKNGAKKIIIAGAHGLFSDPATERMNKAIDAKIIDKIYITNSIESVYTRKIKKLEIIDISPYLSEIIKIYLGWGKNQSISNIYKKG